MNISKFKPRLLMGRDFSDIASASQRRLQDNEGSQPIDWDKDRPFYPDGFTLVYDQFRPQVKDTDAQAVNPMEQSTEENEDLEKPVCVNVIKEASDTSPYERGQNMHRYEDSHTQPADAMQDKGQHWSLSFVPQARGQANIPFQAHLCLLGTVLLLIITRTIDSRK